MSFRLSIFCGHRCCITSFESLFSNQLNESPSSWLWLTGGDCTHVFQNSSAVDFFGADIRWYETDSFSFKCNYFALQQIESLSLALTHWWWLRIFFGIPALVTVGAKKVMSLLALSSWLQLAWLGLGPSFLEDLVLVLVPCGGHLEFYLIRIHQ